MRKLMLSLVLLIVFGLLLLTSSFVVGDDLDDFFDDMETIETTTPEPGAGELDKPAAKTEAQKAEPAGSGTGKVAPKAQVSYVEGEVNRKKYEAPDWVPVKENTKVESREKIRTMVKSRAEIMLDQEKVVRLAPKTTVDLLKLYKEEERKIATEINIDEGRVWANIAKLEDNMNLSLNSKLTVAAVRGTVFSFEVSDTAVTQIKVYRGQLEVYNPFPPASSQSGGAYEVKAPHEVKGPAQVAGPKEVSIEEWTRIVINEMQSFSIGPGEKKPTLTRFSLTDPAEQNEWIKWNKLRDKLFESIRKKTE